MGGGNGKYKEMTENQLFISIQFKQRFTNNFQFFFGFFTVVGHLTLKQIEN